jgi:hypothetical protein
MSRRTLAALLLGTAAACNQSDKREVGLADTSQSIIERVPEDTAPAAAAAAPGPSGDSAAAAEPAIDRAAVRTLERMGTFLRSLKAFQVTASTTRDEVLANGQKVQYASTADMLIQKPNHFYAEVTSDAPHRLFFYDGKTFTMWADGPGYYASVPAPATIHELGDRLEPGPAGGNPGQPPRVHVLLSRHGDAHRGFVVTSS